MQLFFAPVQGHTDAAYRSFHSKIYKGNLSYFTPFLRLEKNNLRPRDLKDLNSDLNKNIHLVPQIIFRDEDELKQLSDLLIKQGRDEIDLNLGCPFPLQTGHGRGAAAISNKNVALALKNLVIQNPEVKFSVKMRLGLNDPDEWQNLLPILNQIKLERIVLHPRIAKQQYGGEPDLERFKEFYKNSKNPVIYNGDITTPTDFKNVKEMFPGIHGVMIGRGLLGRPSLAIEILNQEEWAKEERIKVMLEFHNELYSYYSSVLCGNSQVISKIQPFWEYAEAEIGRKAWKAIKKASSIPKYQTAVAMIQNSL